jgi:hypothetical protein
MRMSSGPGGLPGGRDTSGRRGSSDDGDRDGDGDGDGDGPVSLRLGSSLKAAQRSSDTVDGDACPGARICSVSGLFE